MDMCISHIFRVDHGRVVVTVDQNSCIIYQDLLHLENQICTLVLIHLALQLFKQLIIFRIGISAVSSVRCPVCHVCIWVSGTYGDPVIIVEIIVSGSKFAPLVIGTAVICGASDTDLCQILDMCIGEIIQQTVLIRNVVQVDVFSVDLTDSVSVRIYDTGIVKELFRTFRIIGIWVVQFVVSII